MGIIWSMSTRTKELQADSSKSAMRSTKC